MPLAVIMGSRNISEISWTAHETQKCCSTEELGHTYSVGQKEVAFRLMINDEDLCKIVKLLTGLVQKHALSCLMVGFFFFFFLGFCSFSAESHSAGTTSDFTSLLRIQNSVCGLFGTMHAEIQD